MAQSTLTFSHFIGTSLLVTPSARFSDSRVSMCRYPPHASRFELPDIWVFQLESPELARYLIFVTCIPLAWWSHTLITGYRSITSRDLTTFGSNPCGSNSRKPRIHDMPMPPVVNPLQGLIFRHRSSTTILNPIGKSRIGISPFPLSYAREFQFPDPRLFRISCHASLLMDGSNPIGKSRIAIPTYVCSMSSKNLILR